MSTNFQSLSVARQEKNIPMLFGVALTKNQLLTNRNRKYASYIFDSVTCFNEMKTSRLRTSILDTSYNFTEANYIMDFARNSSMKVCGSTLWYDQTDNPLTYLASLVTNAASKSTMSNILNNHVTTTINHFQTNYPNQIYSWNVLNQVPAVQANRILGPNYFLDLYRYAEVAVRGTSIKLFYNDSFKDIDDHETTLLTLKKEEKIHGVGIQCHVSSTDINNAATFNTIMTKIEEITKKYRGYGFDVHYTEIDFNTATESNPYIKQFYARLLDIALKYGVSNFTVWGLKNDLSPLSSGGTPKYPLLLKSTYQPNDSYKEILRNLKDYTPVQDYDIFIILGQSNSVGWGVTIDPNISKIGNIMDDDYANKEDPDIKQWTNYHVVLKDAAGNTVRDANDKPVMVKSAIPDEIIPARERLYHLQTDNFGKPNENNREYGLAISFARQYIREGKLSRNRKILLIGSGWNGTGFLNQSGRHWQVKTGDISGAEVRLYDMSLERIRSAISPGNVGPNSLVKGIFWVQGEADANHAAKTGTIPAPPLPPSCPPTSPARGTTVSGNRSATERNRLLNEYEGHLTLMLNQLRINVTKYINNVRTFNVQKQLVNAIPILIGSIPNLPFPCNYRDDYLYMIERLRNIPSKCIIPNSKFVPSDDSIDNPVFDHYLTTGGPELNYHYNKSSQIEFGKRFFYFYNNFSINTTDTDYDIFIVMGQSNSAGHGFLEDSSIPRIGNMMDDDYANSEDPNIKQWSGTQIIAGIERLSHLSSIPSGYGPSYDPPRILYGFGTSFARQYVKENKLSRYRKVLLIGCGFDGAGVLKTSGANWKSTSTNSLYDQTITRVRSAINSVGVGRDSKIKGILWHQGETDASYIKLGLDSTATYNSYKTELKKTLDGLRNEFTNIINIKRRSLPPIPSPRPAPPPCPTKPAPAPALAGGAAPAPVARAPVARAPVARAPVARAPAPAARAATDQVATEIPILLGSILTDSSNGQIDTYDYMSMVETIQEIADSSGNINYSFVPVTPISGTVFRRTLTGNGKTSTDWNHFNKSSQIELGKRYFYVYNNNRITTTFAPAPAPR